MENLEDCELKKREDLKDFFNSSKSWRSVELEKCTFCNNSDCEFSMRTFLKLQTRKRIK